MGFENQLEEHLHQVEAHSEDKKEKTEGSRSAESEGSFFD